jgi:dihydrolipoamide dehydrogenase
MSELQYDLAIIGAGPGGYQAAIRAAQYGAKVAIIEKRELGGTCLNRGCIPTKALYASANILEKMKQAEKLGVDVSEYKINFEKAVAHKNQVVKELVEGIEQLEKAWNNDVFRGHGKIKSGNINEGFEVLIEGKDTKTIKAKRIIIATGTSCSDFPVFSIDHKKILTSDDILDPNFKTLPKSLLIIGAGIIGIEFATIFASFGSKVTCLEYLPSPISTEEPHIIKKMMKHLTAKGVEIFTSQNVLSVKNVGSGVEAITVSTDIPQDQIENAEKTIFKAEMCLISIGRTKEIHNIGLEELGIEANRDMIRVKPKTLETSIKGIYAIGDVTGGLMLAHVASYEATIAVANALNSIGGFPVKKMKADYTVVPATIFTTPNIGSVGLRRKQALNRGIRVLTGQFPYQSLGKAKCIGEEEGFLLVFADRDTHKIVGASCIGAEASELIAEIALAMKHGLTVYDVAEVIHSHPTLSEMVLEGVEATVGKAVHKKGRPIHKK